VSARSENIIGTTTVEAMRNGILFGYGAMIDGLAKGISREMVGEGKHVEVIATGGMARLISPYATLIGHIDPNLTLEGLRIIYDKKRDR